MAIFRYAAHNHSISMTRPVITAQHELIARWFFLIVSLVVGYLFWSVIQPFALVLMTAGIMAVVAAPFETRLRRLVRRPGLSAFLIVLIVLVAIVGPLITAGIIMVDQAVSLVRNLIDQGSLFSFDIATHPIFQRLPEAVRNQILLIDIRAILLAIAEWASRNIGMISAGSAGFIFKTFIFFVCLYYFLVDRERVTDQILQLSPFQDKTDRSILERMTRTIRAVVSGSLIVAVVQGVLSAIGMTIFGVPGALIWAALVVVSANIPFVGTAGVLIPAVIYLLATGNVGAAIGLLIWAVVVVGLVDNLLKPYLVEGKTKMHPLLILLTILGGLQVFGPIGLIVGPTVLAVFLALVELYKAGVLEKRTL